MPRASKSIRLFIGTSPGQRLLDEFSRTIATLKSYPWTHHVRWVDPGNMHMTLKFLGNTDAQIVEELIADLHNQLKFEPVVYGLGRIELFPSARQPSVIAAMVTENNGLNDLVVKLEEITRHHGFPVEGRRFRGHFTLARCGKDFPGNAYFEVSMMDQSERLTSISLYRSDTLSSGAVYTPLATMGYCSQR